MPSFFNSPLLDLIQSQTKTPEQQVQRATSPLTQAQQNSKTLYQQLSEAPIEIKPIISPRESTGTVHSVQQNPHTDEVPVNVEERRKQALNALETLIDFTPVIGDIKGLTFDPIRAGIQGGWRAGVSMAGLGLIGLVPGVGDTAKMVGKKLKNIDWKSLRYELDPRYMRVYHATDAPFDINHFYTGTINDSGLHTSKKVLDNQGDVVYKLYTKKPSFRFFDTWSNGAMMFNPNRKFSKGTEFEITPATEQLLKKAGVPYTIEYSNFYQKPAIKIGEDKTVDLSKLIFPNNPELQQSLSDLALKQSQFKSNNGTFDPNHKSEIIKINTEVSDILSKNGYKVGVYKNANPYETVEDTYSIFDPSAIKHSVRIKEKGGKLNENN